MLVGSCFALAVGEEKRGLFAELTYEQALAKAAAEKKLVFIDFYTTWCGPCKKLDAVTWRDAGVIGVLKATAISLKLDAEKHPELAKKYAVKSFPTLLILKADGSVLDRLVGFKEPAEFIRAYEASRQGKTALIQAEEAVQRANAGTDPKAKVDARYDLARQLVIAGKAEEALREYLWLFDVGMIEAESFYGVRLSFLLSDLAALGKSYPPATEALRVRRDQATLRSNGKGEPCSS
jgi:thiol-disulfide isomerase/thioredoxin